MHTDLPRPTVNSCDYRDTHSLCHLAKQFWQTATPKSQYRNTNNKALWQKPSWSQMQLHHYHWYRQFDVKPHLGNGTLCRHATCEDVAQDFICLICGYQNPHPSNFTDLTTPSIPSAGFHHLYNAHNKRRQWAAFIFIYIYIYIYIYIEHTECYGKHILTYKIIKIYTMRHDTVCHIYNSHFYIHKNRNQPAHTHTHTHTHTHLYTKNSTIIIHTTHL